MIKLFYVPNACSLASHIVLEEIGAPYELAQVDFKTGAQLKPAYLAINPKAKVPALATDRGVLTETPAILAYLAQTHPDAKLAPLDDPFAFAKLQGFNDYISATVHVAYAHIFRGARWADSDAAIAEMAAKGPGVVAKHLELIEAEMFAAPWAMGDDYTVADAYLYVMTRWTARADIDLAALPKLADHKRRMEQRPAVQRALSQEGLA